MTIPDSGRSVWGDPNAPADPTAPPSPSVGAPFPSPDLGYGAPSGPTTGGPTTGGPTTGGPDTATGFVGPPTYGSPDPGSNYGGSGGPPALPAAPGYAAPGYPGPGYGEPGYAGPGYGGPGYAGPGYAPQGYSTAGYPMSGAAGYGAYPGFTAAPRTNGLAIASMVTSITGLVLLVCYGIGLVPGLVGAILGHVARNRIKTSGEAGSGMALAGMIIGWICTVLGLIAVAVIVFLVITAMSQARDVPPLQQ